MLYFFSVFANPWARNWASVLPPLLYVAKHCEMGSNNGDSGKQKHVYSKSKCKKKKSEKVRD